MAKKKAKHSLRFIDYSSVPAIVQSITRGQGDEDFIQDVYVRLLEKQGQFKGKSTWKTWVYAIASNLWISKKRHEAVERRYAAKRV